MKINSVTPSEMLYQYVSVRDKQAASRNAPVAADKVEITGDAKTFSAALKKAKEQMDAGMVNQTRIEELRQQIADGTYHVPGYMVAGKILGE